MVPRPRRGGLRLTAPTPAGLEVRDLRFTYPARRGERTERQKPVLGGVTLTVAPGELVCVLGPSGIGKTTLLRCIAGLERTYSGSVSLDARNLDGLPPHERRVGMLFQEPALFPHLDVQGNVAFGLRYHKQASEADRDAAVARWLKVVGLGGQEHSAVDALSGGQRQRVALARTLAAHPAAVMLDEPLAALDHPLAKRIGLEIRDILHDAGVPAVWVTHDETFAHMLADRVHLMSERGTLGVPIEREAAP